MGFWFPGIVTTDDGVYRPSPSPAREALMLAPALALVAGGVAFGRIATGTALGYAVLAAALIGGRMLGRRRHGPLGRPCIAIEGADLRIGLPGDRLGELRYPIAELARVQVYGRKGRFTYRFTLRDGRQVECRPLWGAKVERAVLAFLQRRLPELVTIEEPQTAFAEVRGDGPAEP